MYAQSTADGPTDLGPSIGNEHSTLPTPLGLGGGEVEIDRKRAREKERDERNGSVFLV